MFFKLDDFEPFLDAVSIMHRLDGVADFKTSPSMFTIIIPVNSYSCVVALKFTPPFFNKFNCGKFQYVTASIEEFFMNMLDMRRRGCSSMALSILEYHHHMVIEYRSIGRRQHSSTIIVPISIPSRQQNVGEIDYGSFVSFDLEVFRTLALWLDNTDIASVTITNSQISFLVRHRRHTLTAERRECIIGGVAVGEEINSSMTLNPIEFFYNFTSKRLWLFKSKGSNCLMLIAPMGLHAQISSYYFPHKF